MMEHATYQRWAAQARAMRSELLIDNGRHVPAGLALLMRAINQETDPSDRSLLYGLYFQECFDLERGDLELEAHRQHIAEQPNNPVARASMAEAIHRITRDIPEAIRIARAALHSALEVGQYINYTASNLARLAVDGQDFAAVNEAIRVMVNHASGPKRIDCAPEGDFLSGISPDAINEELLSSYRQLLRE